jgi:hypothetical protein
MNRRWEIDWLRGFMLVMMFSTHLPSWFSNPFGQPFGYVSAAEGFVMLSGFMTGLVYSGRAEKDGIPAMRRAFFNRALTVYICHAALLVFLFSLIAALGLSRDQPALTGLLEYYLRDPWAALPGALMLVYDPPLLDILPLYILLLFASPFIVAWSMNRGWTGIFAVSGMLWACAQFGFSEMLYAKLVRLTDLRVPFSETGAFESYAWQFLWVLGLWMGASTANGTLKNRKPFPIQLVIAALLIAAICLVWRHVAGQIPVPGRNDHLINLLFDKWHLGPLRLINFFALLILVMHFADWLSAHTPRISFLEDLGSASLPVFCMHLVFVLLALGITGQYKPGRPLWIDVLLLGTGLATLYVTARITIRLDKKERARMIERKKMKKARPLAKSETDVVT